MLQRSNMVLLQITKSTQRKRTEFRVQPYKQVFYKQRKSPQRKGLSQPPKVQERRGTTFGIGPLLTTHWLLSQTEHFWKSNYLTDEKWSESHSVMSDSLRPHGLYSPWNSPGQNTGVGSLSLLQGIFPTQGSNPGLPHYRWILYQLSHQGSPRILEWVAYPFSSRSSQPRNRTGVSCIAGRFFTNWAIQSANGKLITDWISSYPTIMHQKKPHT